MPAGCRTDAGRMPAGCRTDAGRMLDSCRTDAGRMPDGCRRIRIGCAVVGCRRLAAEALPGAPSQLQLAVRPRNRLGPADGKWSSDCSVLPWAVRPVQGHGPRGLRHGLRGLTLGGADSERQPLPKSNLRRLSESSAMCPALGLLVPLAQRPTVTDEHVCVLPVREGLGTGRSCKSGSVSLARGCPFLNSPSPTHGPARRRTLRVTHRSSPRSERAPGPLGLPVKAVERSWTDSERLGSTMTTGQKAEKNMSSLTEGSLAAGGCGFAQRTLCMDLWATGLGLHSTKRNSH
jgi:hypothetical protein